MRSSRWWRPASPRKRPPGCRLSRPRHWWLLTVPASKFLWRRTMFAIYFLASGLAVLAAFGLPMEPRTRLFMYFPIGLSVFGVFGAFTYYLPELYPTRLRGTGAGFC